MTDLEIDVSYICDFCGKKIPDEKHSDDEIDICEKCESELK